jgi:hypothetical protein
VSINVDINGSRSDVQSAGQPKDMATKAALCLLVGAWGIAVVGLAYWDQLARLYQPVIGAIVAATITVPTVWYFLSPALRRVVEATGHRRIAIFHIWRIPAAILFFWYGMRGQLPPLFWILAGTGDLIAGFYAAWITFRPKSASQYRRFHSFGFADFVVAVGTGLTYTLLLDPRMAPITTLPLALVPLFGVGISGATHLMAFDMLRRSVGFKKAP